MKTRMPSDAVPRKPMALGPRRADAKRLDIFHQYQIDPVKEAMNSLIMSAYVSDMGKIKNRAESQLTWKSQRRMGKAIRRAKNMGIIPLLSRRSLKSAQDQ
ncbi:uncharacterized protein PHACADRAFT_249407 [Phanerochaete carnosa HHB-10118-sp]|uniref:Small ribosomal subunit protein bS18m n=1 Tax=Phanerochaete carnosa (strain HHB-10118-sp) TaxID=650164 RepID=K5WJ57_PHACS|nr:uncharacterized protein PHACADRAFT_249407 [Phanerochaete carnosa HHB-10118-sp]EKM59154.1 hypothetical protein PHACADRAFT_249407 [Phanerochaete carnosa HHB-10118-sp]